MKTWKKIALALGILTIAGGSIAWGGHAARNGKFMQRMVNARIEKVLTLIDATPEQRQLVDQVKQDLIAKVQAKHQEHRGLHQQITSMVTADTLDVKALDALIDARADEMRAFAHDVVKDVAKIHATLTPAQRQKLSAHFAAMKAQHEQRHKDQGGFGGAEE